MICDFQGCGTACEKVMANEPWHPDQWQCPKCDSTYCIENVENNQKVSKLPMENSQKMSVLESAPIFCDMPSKSETEVIAMLMDWWDKERTEK